MADPNLTNFTPGSVFHDRYRIHRCIQMGGMGAVYEVLDQRTESRRALKVMLPELVQHADLRRRFEREAKVTGNITSDHLVLVSDSGVDDATRMPFLAMELLRGEDTANLLLKHGTLSPADVVLYLSQAALALDKVHAAGVVHRDLKPENLFISKRDDGSPCLKLLDFGVAKIVHQHFSQSLQTRAMGTPLFMAPEQLRGEGLLGPASDLYALGQVAYNLLVGEPYWVEEAVASDSIFAFTERLEEGASERPSRRAYRRRAVTLSAMFDSWFFHATAIDPTDRFESAASATKSLAEALLSPAPNAPPRPELTPMRPASAVTPLVESRGPSVRTMAAVTSEPPTHHASQPRTIAMLAVATLIGATAGLMLRARSLDPQQPPSGVAAAALGAAAPAEAPQVSTMSPVPVASAPPRASVATPSRSPPASGAASPPSRAKGASSSSRFPGIY